MLNDNSSRAPQNMIISNDKELMGIKDRIGERLKKARGKRTLADVAKNTKKLTITRISNYERGQRTPGPEEAIELARALGNITPAEVLCVDDASNLSSVERQLLSYFRSTDARGQATIVHIASLQPTTTPSPTAEQNPDEDPLPPGKP